MNQTPSDLAAFLQKHVRPYDPVTDDYERPAFAADIKEGKNDPIYNAHSYHTKVPPRSIIPYILHYTKPGDLVLDLFCGSGMTGVAAQMCTNPPADLLAQFPELKDRLGSRACVLNDLSPAACHIAYNYNTPVDVNALRQEFARIKLAVQKEFDYLYGTEHYEPAVGLYSPSHPEVASRLKNSPLATPKHTFLDDREGTWELLTKVEVESRLGYPVSDLPRDEKWGNLDITNVAQWVSIPASIQYTIRSDVYQCAGLITVEEPTGKISARGKSAGKQIVTKRRVERGCHKEIVLWDAAVDQVTWEVNDTFRCPHCNQIWKKLQLTRSGDKPVYTAIEYVGITEKGKSKHFKSGRKVSRREHELILSLEEKTPVNHYPSAAIDPGREMMRHGLLARGLTHLNNFYSGRLLHALSIIWAKIAEVSSDRERRALQFAFTAILHRCSRLNRLRPSGAGDPLTGTLYIGSVWRENHVLNDFIERQEIIIEIAQKLNVGGVFIRNGSATNLLDISDSSIDYIFTDPPFGSNLFYADCSMLWESWLGGQTDELHEMVVSDRRVGGPFKTLDDYTKMMTVAMREAYRVLKPGRWATIEFNNSDGAVFEAIKRAVTEAGFNIENMLLLDKTQKSFKQTKGANSGEDVVDKDVLFNLHKPAEIGRVGVSLIEDIEQQIADAVRAHLQTLPDRVKAEPAKYSDDHRTTSTINSMLMNTLIPRGVSVERLNLPFIERVCGRYFRKIGMRWYLRGEVIGQSGWLGEEVEIGDEFSAIAWLRQQIASGPKLIGELKPRWMRATGLLSSRVAATLSLDRLLMENFWRETATNRWREPTVEEREKMNDDRSLRVLHEAERLVAGTFGRSVGNVEVCQWIKVLFETCRELEDGVEGAVAAHLGFDRVEGYRLIVQLSNRLTPDGLEPKVLSDARKQAAVAGRRLAESPVSSPALTQRAGRSKKDEGPTLFDLTS
jgi:hypothetical protein